MDHLFPIYTTAVYDYGWLLRLVESVNAVIVWRADCIRMIVKRGFLTCGR